MLSNDALIDKEVEIRISRASTSFGQLYSRVWNQKGLGLQTKLKVYTAVVLTNLLYRCETWTCYRRHIKALDGFHMRHLHVLLKIKWQDLITNAEVLKRSQSTGIEALLIVAQLRWVGHVWRMEDERIPKQLLLGELWKGGRHRGGQRKRCKDTLKHGMKRCGISVDQWETVAGEKATWRAASSRVSNSSKRRDSQPWVRRERPGRTACSSSKQVQKAANIIPQLRLWYNVSEIATRE